jgi:cyclin-dependent kinase 12/13
MYDMWAAAREVIPAEPDASAKTGGAKPAGLVTELVNLELYFRGRVGASRGAVPLPLERIGAMRSYSARSVEAYEKIEQVGEGTYGEVFMARSRDDSSLVALKKVKLEGEREGFPITAIREIKILKSLNHDNVINMKEIVTSKNKSSIYMVFEYMDHDLTGLAGREGIKFSIPQIKCYMQQLLTGLNYCHLNNILHRDIKGANLLIDNNGVLKLADFGLARSCALENSRALTNRVITLWYRPPELLLGTQAYGPAVDTWSAGCIFAELLLGKPILQVRVSSDARLPRRAKARGRASNSPRVPNPPSSLFLGFFFLKPQGKSETEQLDLIFKLCGTPSAEDWPGLHSLPWAKTILPTKKAYPRRVQEVFRRAPPSARRLVERFLTLDPEKRVTARDALDSDYFWEEPLPCKPGDLPKYEPSHEFQTRKRKQEASRAQEERARRAPAPGAGAGYGAAAKYAGYRAAAPLGSWAAPAAGGMTASWAQPKKKDEAE